MRKKIEKIINKYNCDNKQELIFEIEKLIDYYTKDALTGAFVRKILDEDLKNFFTSKKNKNKQFTIYMIDINNLHEYNRKFGFEQGDQYIKNIINKIKSEIDKNNINAKIYRIGGDEFLVISESQNDFLKNLRDEKDFIIAKSTFSNSINSFRRAMRELDKEIIMKKQERSNNV